MDGIRPEFAALLRAHKSIRAGEKSFARDSALLRISPVPFVRRLMLGILGDVEHATKVLEFKSPLLGGQSAKSEFRLNAHLAHRTFCRNDFPR
jgi:hypothetical protein